MMGPANRRAVPIADRRPRSLALESKIDEKGNVDQRIAAGGMPDRDR
jgi:hypothetical protein